VITFLNRALHVLDVLLEWVIVALMVSLVAIVALQFVDRHFIDTGIAAPDQYARIALIWLTFIGFAVALRAAVNIRVDLIDAHLPQKVRHFLEMAFDVLLIVLLIVMIPGSWRLIEIGKDQDLLGTVFTAAVPPIGALIAFVLMLLFVGLRFVVRLTGRELAKPEEI
jgi:TRAP-type C4-dicarboxylate transport system permease small subunit